MYDIYLNTNIDTNIDIKMYIGISDTLKVSSDTFQIFLT